MRSTLARPPPALAATLVLLPLLGREPPPAVTHFLVDDQLHLNAKVRSLLDPCLDGDIRGLAAIGMWTLAGSFAQSATSDGVVTRHDLIRLLLNPSLADAFAAHLVAEGLWHPSGHTCPRCPAVAPGTWLFHDWFVFGRYDNAEQLKTKRLKYRELKDPALINAVWARDCTDPDRPGTAACRYCGRTVHRATRKASGDTAASLDHVDPNLAVGVRNVVIACLPCNQAKGQRTPQQAGMTLLPPPRPTTDDPTSPLAVSPRHRAAETPQDGTTAPDTTIAVSPPPGAAETPQDAVPSSPGHAAPAGQEAPQDAAHERPPITESITDPITTDRSVIGGIPARVRAGRAGGAGSGQGPGLGDQQGSEHGAGQGRRRRRRRSRAGRPDPTTSPAAPDQAPTVSPRPGPQPGLDAGAAPEVPTPGRWGSPYFGWTGPPDRTGDETRCPAHPDCHQPCRRCASAATEETP